jgi:NAD(P)H-hydrate epimerase
MKVLRAADIRLAPRRAGTHKGQNGRVLVIGGSEDYPGSPALVGLAALGSLRAGADLVTVAAPGQVAWAVNAMAPDLITRKFACRSWGPRQIRDAARLAKGADAVVLGNGITLTPASREFIRLLVRHFSEHGKPLVLDAGALHVVRIQDCRGTVLTPHAREYEDLLRHSGIEGHDFRDIQERLRDNVILLKRVHKGHGETVILGKTRAVVNRAGTAAMTKGGTGDVLTGLTAGLIAQGNDPYMAAACAAYVNGKAGELLTREQGFGFTASDLARALPRVLKRFQHIA